MLRDALRACYGVTGDHGATASRSRGMIRAVGGGSEKETRGDGADIGSGNTNWVNVWKYAPTSYDSYVCLSDVLLRIDYFNLRDGNINFTTLVDENKTSHYSADCTIGYAKYGLIIIEM